MSDAAPEDPFQDPELPGLVAAALESRDAGREVDVVELCGAIEPCGVRAPCGERAPGGSEAPGIAPAKTPGG